MLSGCFGFYLVLVLVLVLVVVVVVVVSHAFSRVQKIDTVHPVSWSESPSVCTSI